MSEPTEEEAYVSNTIHAAIRMRTSLFSLSRWLIGGIAVTEGIGYATIIGPGGEHEEAIESLRDAGLWDDERRVAVVPCGPEQLAVARALRVMAMRAEAEHLWAKADELERGTIPETTR